ncbi:exodeoxyribonuclease VII large subunit [Aequitasia blattaphilus]|uniref:Exodeoxyribonuclease 7 large subunit n=1 Tax=Aequitasia blattaphilus TaxID=2949332 RepID=A0ABT1E853_9FIRM|nr:exodeoxyribonuclease VII large subunit [Aequitasia blattaphilus]MCP1101162.1 exodeoxyribonuclease VII large subunit [Aequitasia blattaphilus]MCR8613802.1 exodeoxyribonuclease VII large subunit [Aequitasia blattaphilus]
MAKSVYTVKQVNTYIKNMFNQDFLLPRLYVKGEVSNCKYHTSGHIYFSLKDESGTIACVMFAGSRSGLAFRMQEGQQVIVFGGINVYERGGNYQLYAKEIRLDGEGVLYEKFMALKTNLEEMGMFAQEYKKDIPSFPEKIGIVTAQTGAAIKDIMQIAKRRNPSIQLILYPAQVQGDGAKESIVRGIKALDAYGVDVMIVGRGGGSIEDLWAFNEEEVARAIFEAETPVISAVGHETDTTIADFVADLRAPTPSAGAELAIPDRSLLKEGLRKRQEGMKKNLFQKIKMARIEVENTKKRLLYLHPQNMLQTKQRYLLELEEKLQNQIQGKLREEKHHLAILVEKMKGLSPLIKLNQGFSYVEDRNKKTIRSILDVEKNDEVKIYVTDGAITANISGTMEVDYGSKKE